MALKREYARNERSQIMTTLIKVYVRYTAVSDTTGANIEFLNSDGSTFDWSALEVKQETKFNFYKAGGGSWQGGDAGDKFRFTFISFWGKVYVTSTIRTFAIDSSEKGYTTAYFDPKMKAGSTEGRTAFVTSVSVQRGFVSFKVPTNDSGIPYALAVQVTVIDQTSSSRSPKTKDTLYTSDDPEIKVPTSG